jgi:penicillin-binding protein 1B
LRRLGVDREVPPYPAVLLGAVDLSPLEVAGIYQTIANGGFRAPVKGVRAVLNRDGLPLERFPLAVEQTVEAEPLFLLTTALEGVVESGTAAPLARTLSQGFRSAGKTGTTNDLRDSWYAGFTADWLAVAWLGLDDNRPCGLSGATGALEVWAEFFARAGGVSLAAVPPPGVAFAWVDRVSGQGVHRGDERAVHMPFVEGSVPEEADRRGPGLWDNIKGLFRGERR